MRCYVYKSLLKNDTYVYLRRRDDFGAMPAGLRRLLGALEHVLTFELDATRKLAREDPGLVLASLRRQGYHLQLPESSPAPGVLLH